MKSGANRSDQNTIKRLEGEGYSSAQISAMMQVDEETVKGFMKDPDAESNVDQPIDPTILEEFMADKVRLEGEIEILESQKTELTDEVGELESAKEKIDELAVTIGELTEQLEAGGE